MKRETKVLAAGILLASMVGGLGQPVITAQPQNQTNVHGSTAMFTVGAMGAPPLSYQWRSYAGTTAFTNIPWGTDATLLLTNVQPTGRRFGVVVSDTTSSITSVLATLTALLPPSIIPSTSFQSQAVFVRTGTTFTVTTAGSAPFWFQWRLNGRELPEGTNGVLTLNDVQPADEGDYTVVVSNVAGVVISEAARLYVAPSPTNWIRGNFTNGAGLRLPYFLFLPSNYDPTRSYPLVCQFHGSPLDENAWAASLANRPQALVFGSYQQQATDPAIVVWPSRRAGDGSWTDQYLQQVSDLIDSLISSLNIDVSRVYVAGFSEGGHAVWDLSGLRPGFFAAARILAGWQGNTRVDSIKNLPLWAFHAVNDSTVGVNSSRTLIRALRQAGGSPVYTEFNSGGHIEAILQAQCIPAGVDWFLAQRRGTRSAVGPLVSITSPTQNSTHFTGATNLNLAGTAEALDRYAAPVTWENLANSAKGNAAGTNVWSAMGIPLQANRTNLILVVE